MIKSIKFPKRGKGYIYDKELKNTLGQTLVGKTFKFEDKKPNVIFGPNASGKSTILKTIGALAYTTSEWTRMPKTFQKPLFDWLQDYLKGNDIKENRKKYGLSTMVASIDWDGTPVFLTNMVERLSKSHTFGELIGDVLPSGVDEICLHMDAREVSTGQLQLMILQKVLGVIKKPKTLDDVINSDNPEENEFAQYICEKYGEGKGRNTILFDEFDHNLDYLKAYNFWYNLVPQICGISQVIAITHNPLILKEEFGNKLNIISLYPDYTEKCRLLMGSTNDSVREEIFGNF